MVLVLESCGSSSFNKFPNYSSSTQILLLLEKTDVFAFWNSKILIYTRCKSAS